MKTALSSTGFFPPWIASQSSVFSTQSNEKGKTAKSATISL
jgi:hypothetical protein